mmetsp:Transcript_33060/g.43521  ORF Transcript_33060/g.43521 Transcript_33060/m.43521 type:complete len:341 (-) Transcript_33060:154-1176(-)
MDSGPTLQNYAPEIEEKLISVISKLLEATAQISQKLKAGISHEVAGTQNRFGDNQLEVDIATDRIVFDRLKESGAVSIASSEETPEENDLGGEGYSVGFDPLDGSSIIDANFSVGSIFGVWPGKGLQGRTGREQVASVVTQYGPRTTAAIALAPTVTGGEGKAFEVTINAEGNGFVVSKEAIQIKSAGKVFAPGNLRATSDNPKYSDLVQFWIRERYTLRYTGGMVPDVYHILMKSKGVFANVSSPTAIAKLRLLYECAPIGLLVECAGGASCVAPPPSATAVEPAEKRARNEEEDEEQIEQASPTPMSILDVPIDDLDKRCGVCYGSVDEVEHFKRFMF